MAKYTAEITNKDLIDGELVIQIRYTGDDGTIIQDSARTKGAQDEGWAEKIIAKKIADLENLPTFVDSITLGEVTLTEKAPIVVEATPKEQFMKDYQKFSKLFMLVRQGLLDSDNKEFTDLQQKLKDSLDLEYIDVL